MFDSSRLQEYRFINVKESASLLLNIYFQRLTSNQMYRYFKVTTFIKTLVSLRLIGGKTFIAP